MKKKIFEKKNLKKKIVVDVVVDVIVLVLLLLSLGSRSALVTRTGTDFLPRFSNCHLEFGKIAAVVVAVAVVVAGIVRTRTLRDQLVINHLTPLILSFFNI